MGGALSLVVPEAIRPAGPSHQDDPLAIIQLFGGGCHDVYRDVFAAKLAIVESHAAFCEREQRVILADTDIGARINAGAVLANDDIAADHVLTAELLDAEAATGRVATVARRAACFLVCHLD